MLYKKAIYHEDVTLMFFVKISICESPLKKIKCLKYLHFFLINNPLLTLAPKTLSFSKKSPKKIV